ncbi:BglG family transcription antiterminator [Lactococcus termiticola]|uniref:Transcriptional regulator n=1 Tax=Lactococcus termiticola TaxID=2169526 RepID=A0A2R5HKF8_9LACT|nr:transcription antiterminator [Lactococcus termiticola]GBG97330.1 transcriptional regulator [Lactococcus termiticola]
MLVSSREQKLIDAFQTEESLSIAQMLEVTGTSRRTLYRDLERLQESLPDGYSIKKTHGGYQLIGNLESLAVRELQDFTARERLFGELLLLMDGEASIASITETFAISQPTASNDLKLIEAELNENDLALNREKGLKLTGDEASLRSMRVAATFDNSSIQEILNGDFQSNKMAGFLDLESLSQARLAFEKLPDLDAPDRTRSLMILFLSVSLQRIKRGHLMTYAARRKPSKLALDFIQSLIASSKLTNFSLPEMTYLATIYDALYFAFGLDFLYVEKFDTDFSYQIRQLIDLVSDKVKMPFSKDSSLYGLLYAHLKGSEIMPSLFAEKENDFVRRIATENAKLFEASEEALHQVFGKKFPVMEIAYVALHFASTLERSDSVLPLRAALVSSRGRISCELIMSNLKKNFPYLKRIDFIQSSADFNEGQYDVIFTTEKESSYIYVNRMPSGSELDQLRRRLRKIQQEVKQPRDFADTDGQFINLNQLFNAGNEILETFTVSQLENEADLLATVRQLLADILGSDNEAFSQLLVRRFEETHLAIPSTKLALIHGLDDSVERPIFKIVDLTCPLEVTAMDRKMIRAERLLVLLSGQKVSDSAAFLLGKISSSIIENKLYTTIYNSGNQEVVSELLKQIITEAIQKDGQ